MRRLKIQPECMKAAADKQRITPKFNVILSLPEMKYMPQVSLLLRMRSEFRIGISDDLYNGCFDPADP